MWELLRRDGDVGHFTAQDFCEKHLGELKRAIAPINPGASLERIVTGALQGLVKKGLLGSIRGAYGTVFTTHIYILDREILRYEYGRAMVEAQRLRLL